MLCNHLRWRQVKDKTDNEDIETDLVGDFKFDPQLKKVLIYYH